MKSAEKITIKNSELFDGLFLLQYYEHDKRVGYGYITNPNSKREIKDTLEQIRYFFRENFLAETHKPEKKIKIKKVKKVKKGKRAK